MPSAESQFFVWARGRWRELSLSSGRVQGAGGPVRFLFVNSGRLEAVRAPRVLRALRALAGGKPSAVKDGMPLPQRRCVRRRARRSRSGRRHCCCAAHAHAHQCNTSFIKAPKVQIQTTIQPPRSDAAIQVTAIPTIETTSQGSLILKSPLGGKPTLVETMQLQPQQRTKRKRSPTPKKIVSDTSSIEGVSLAAIRRHQELCKELIINEDDVDLYRSFLLKSDPNFDVYRFDMDDDFKMQLFYRINPLVSLSPCKRLETMLYERRASQETISLKDFATKLGLRSISDQESENNKKRYKMRRRNNDSIVTSSTSDDKTDKESLVENRKTESRSKHRRQDRSVESKKREISENSSNSSSDQESDSDERRKMRQRTNNNKVMSSTSDEDTDKENFVRNSRTELRSQHRKDKPVESIKGEMPENRKKEIPENRKKDISVERESRSKEMSVDKPKIVERNKKEVSAEKQKTVESSKKEVENKPKTVENSKKEVENKQKTVDSSKKEVENKQKPVDPPVDRTLRKRLMVEAVQRNINTIGKSDKKNVEDKKAAVVVVSSSSDSSKGYSKNKPRFFTKKPTAPKTNVTKVVSLTAKTSVASKKSCGGRVYAPGEDHAIVAFVSGGDRARLVNGNRVWRQLEEQYHRLTGQSRSWHSLRNRYLRYILPSLGDLALSPKHAARLRAQAARGEIKSHRRPSAPNPLCVVPRVRSAFGARAHTPSPNLSPPPPASEERTLRARKKEPDMPVLAAASPTPPPRRSLRSSGVVPPSPLPTTAPPTLPQARVRPRMRKLFNPNAPQR